MSVVKFNVLTVPEGAGPTLEERFAKRAGLVEGQPGFEDFQLLRPVEGNDKYLVYTRWRSEEDFQNWVNGPSFRKGHAQAAADAGRSGDGHGHGHGHGHGEGSGPAATGSEIWTYEVVQHVGARQ
ncbi:antibiotic biosynthesis monooxygenase family protein [Nocardiopsis algeriensis]|uniref:Heme-degrading monooxygenase HmoA n=1 Tax=Nocardiopsis algeriensis TaxID=1478215 RepID=A0A841IIU3_9ACTN|nr:antibiotic biosynthesis monooxygenase [Nocardiopsis algeriensis]MBB6118593.1 heme-degrading monooxygenase HmoA [Nocardiopsis algeriensis]